MKTRWHGLLIALFLIAFPSISYAADQVPAPSTPQASSTDHSHANKSTNFKGAWVVGLQAGPTGAPQTMFTNFLGSNANLVSGVGPYVSANALYGVWSNVLIGLDIDYNSLPVNVNTTSFNLGNTSTVSLLPTIEVRTDDDHNFSFYASLGLGVNFNNFSNSSSLNALCSGVTCAINPSDSFAARLGLGMDYFVTQNFALNTELGYLFNYTSASLMVTAPGIVLTTGNGTVDASTFFWLFGFHYRSWIGL